MSNIALRVGIFLLALLISRSTISRDIQTEAKVVFDMAGSDQLRGIGLFAVRTPESSKACLDSILQLPLDSDSNRLLYSLLLSAHVGERVVSVWFDVDNDCRITQGQIHE